MSALISHIKSHVLPTITTPLKNSPLTTLYLSQLFLKKMCAALLVEPEEKAAWQEWIPFQEMTRLDASLTIAAALTVIDFCHGPKIAQALQAHPVSSVLLACAGKRIWDLSQEENESIGASELLLLGGSAYLIYAGMPKIIASNAFAKRWLSWIG